uniref:Uncharacterized protein n=1 Tax=Pristionchus pacificus TaxID=54126 RepID=A0A8R1V812_PRIPA
MIIVFLLLPLVSSQLRPTSVPFPRVKRDATNSSSHNKNVDIQEYYWRLFEYNNRILADMRKRFIQENKAFTQSAAFNVGTSSDSIEEEKSVEEERSVVSKIEDEFCTSDKTIIEKLLHSYNSFKTPSETGVTVWIEVWVQEVNAVNEITSDFDMDIYVTELWMDDALRYEHLNPCKYNLSLNSEILEKIWKPNTVFINSKSAHIHMSPFKNVFLMIYPNGTVWVNYRVQVKGPCSMDFSSFPMDHQLCYLTLESFSYNNKEVDMQWTNSTSAPLSLLKEEIVLPDFVLSNYSTYIKTEIYPAGMWNELTMTFTFTRRYGWYIFQAYIPTYLTIFISWISFCLGAKMMPARTMLGVNSLLALTFQFGNIMRNLPRVSYVKALDVWMLVCLTFVFSSLLELAIIGSISSRREAREKSPPPPPRRRSHEEGGTHAALLHRLNQVDKSSMSMSPRLCRNHCSSEGDTTTSSPMPTLHAMTNYGTLEETDHDTSAKFIISRRIKAKREDRLLLVDETSFSPPTIEKCLIHSPFTGELIRSERKGIFGRVWDWAGSLSTDRIDTFSIWLFPSLFGIFNIIYWSYYLSRPGPP